MASLSYLWKNRAKFPISNKSFYAAWAKRFLTLNGLIRRNRFKNRLIRKGAIISHTAEVTKSKIQGKMNNLFVDDNAMVGDCFIMLHDEVKIGKNVCINSGVIILTASHGVNDPEWKTIRKPISIGDYAWIASGAIIMPGVNIGEGAVVGAGAVVSKDVGVYEIVVGNPAKVLSKKRIENLIYNPCEFLAGNSAWLKG